MKEEFDIFAPLLNTELDSVSFSRSALTLYVSGKIEGENIQYQLSTNADICFREEQVFTPYSEYHIYDPTELEKFVPLFGKKITGFLSTGKKERCVSSLKMGGFLFGQKKKGSPIVSSWSNKYLGTQRINGG